MIIYLLHISTCTKKPISEVTNFKEIFCTICEISGPIEHKFGFNNTCIGNTGFTIIIVLISLMVFETVFYFIKVTITVYFIANALLEIVSLDDSAFGLRVSKMYGVFFRTAECKCGDPATIRFRV